MSAHLFACLYLGADAEYRIPGVVETHGKHHTSIDLAIDGPTLVTLAIDEETTDSARRLAATIIAAADAVDAAKRSTP